MFTREFSPWLVKARGLRNEALHNLGWLKTIGKLKKVIY